LWVDSTTTRADGIGELERESTSGHDQLSPSLSGQAAHTDVLIAMNDDVVVGVVPIADVAAAFS